MNQLGCFGKLPSEPDFIRLNAGCEQTRQLDLWLRTAVGKMQAISSELTTPNLHYLMYWPNKPGAPLVGSLGPSVDKVGRFFPVSFHGRIADQNHPLSWAHWPHCLAPHLAALDSLRYQCQTRRSAEIAAVLQEFEGSAENPWIQYIQHPPLLDTQRLPAQQLLSVLFGDEPDSLTRAAYGVSMVSAACNSHPSADSPIILDTSIQHPVGLYFWLELIRTLRGPKGPMPSIFWTVDAPRMLVSLGGPSPDVLAYFARPEQAAGNLWPLETQDPKRRDAGAKALSSNQYSALTDPPTLADQLFAALVPQSSTS